MTDLHDAEITQADTQTKKRLISIKIGIFHEKLINHNRYMTKLTIAYFAMILTTFKDQMRRYNTARQARSIGMSDVGKIGSSFRSKGVPELVLI